MGGFLLEKIMAQSGNNTGNYNYSQPNITPSSVGGQTVNGVNNVGGYQMPDLSSVGATNNANSQAFNSAQLNQANNFTGAYQSAANAMPTYQTLLNNANQQYNVQPLAENANALNNQVLQIPQTYSQATQGSDTNNNQLMQLIGQKQWELQPLATAATNTAQTAQGLANNMVNYGVQNEAQLLSPYANTVGLQNTVLSNAGTNFTQAQSDQLNGLIALAQSGATLSADQLAQLTSLQNTKTQYDEALAAAKLAAAAPGQAQITAGNTYYNPNTGQYYNPTTKVSAPT